MQRFRIFISIVVLAASLFLLFNKLFTPQPIQIILESGQEVTTSTPEYFSLAEVLLLIVSAFLIGSTAVYLFYNSDSIKTAHLPSQVAGPALSVYDAIIPLLKPDERRVIAILREADSQIQQNKLAAKLGLSRVKVTRLLYSLEHKRLISKERYGLTNMVRLLK